MSAHPTPLRACPGRHPAAVADLLLVLVDEVRALDDDYLSGLAVHVAGWSGYPEGDMDSVTLVHEVFQLLRELAGRPRRNVPEAYAGPVPLS